MAVERIVIVEDEVLFAKKLQSKLEHLDYSQWSILLTNSH